MVKMSKYYSDGIRMLPFSFNFARLDISLFELNNWMRFTHFVKQLSDAVSFRSTLDFTGYLQPSASSASDAMEVEVASSYCSGRKIPLVDCVYPIHNSMNSHLLL